MAYCISDIPRTIKRVVVLTNHHADGLCPLYDNETRLNDPTAPGRNKNEWDKTKGRERWNVEGGKKYRPRFQFTTGSEQGVRRVTKLS